VEYRLSVLNWSTTAARGMVKVTTDGPREPGFALAFNSPDCDDGCQDPAGTLRAKLVEAIESAQRTIDLAMYGLDDPTLVEAICNAAKGGVAVRLVSDDDSIDPADPRSYAPAFVELMGCGVMVQPV